jgi:hypothetical protein
MPVQGRIHAFATENGEAAHARRSMEKDENHACFSGALATCLAALNISAMLPVPLAALNAGPLPDVAESCESSPDNNRTQELSNSANAGFSTIAGDSGLRDVFGPDQPTSRLQQAYGSTKRIDPAEQLVGSNGNDLGDKSSCLSSTEVVSKAAVIRYNDVAARKRARSQSLTIDNQPVGVAAGERYQNLQPNVSQRTGTETDANEHSFVHYALDIVNGPSAGLESLASGHARGISSSDRQSKELTPLGSKGDGVQRLVATSRPQSSGWKFGEQLHAPAVSGRHIGKAAQSRGLEDEQATPSDQKMNGLVHDACDESARNELSHWPATKPDKERETRAAPASQSSLKIRADGSSRRLGNFALGNVVQGEIGRVSGADANTATYLPGGAATQETGTYGLTSRPLRRPDHPELENAATLKVELDIGGSVRANIRERSGAIEVRMATDDSQAVRRLTGEVDTLRSSLGNSGLKLQSFEVNYQNDQRQRRPNQPLEPDSRNRRYSDGAGHVFTIVGSDQ